MAKSDDTKGTKGRKEKPSKESARSKARSGDPSKRADNEAAIKEAEAKERHRMKAQKVGNPPWFVPLMLGLMLIGLVWVVTFYITQQQYPVASWGRWNLGIGFAFILAGFAMTTRWR